MFHFSMQSHCLGIAYRFSTTLGAVVAMTIWFPEPLQFSSGLLCSSGVTGVVLS